MLSEFEGPHVRGEQAKLMPYALYRYAAPVESIPARVETKYRYW
jgi:hypothetical protein